MTDLIDTTEMYLRTLFELEEEGVVPLRARIAQRIGHSGPTVSQTVARMERDGLLTVRGDRHLELSDQGRARAIRVMRKHRLAERLLVDVIGIDWADAHDEACRWEHVMSVSVERRLVELLGRPVDSPYGNPIPGLTELSTLGEPGVPATTDVLLSLADVKPGNEVIIRRIGEALQTDAVTLNALDGAGARPGARVSVDWRGADVLVSGAGGTAVLPEGSAAQIRVAAR